MDDFAVRISGDILPAQSGPYRFILHVQGDALLRLYDNGILEGANGEHLSGTVQLAAGDSVPFELLHKSGRGPDSLRLGWILPDGTSEIPIGGERLAAHSPWEEIRAENMRQVLIDSRLRTYDADRHMALHPHNPRPGEHIVRETFYTAGSLLESEDPEEHEEAFRAIRAVIGLQNTYEPSNSFGNWPRVVQQPGNFNAQNIGGFIDAEIIMILQRHGEKLPEDLREQLRTALRNAAHRSRRYNPPVTATNIVTKAVALALVADAMLDIPEARAWGKPVCANCMPTPSMPEEFHSFLKPLAEPETREIPVLGGGRQPDVISQQSPVPLVSTVHLDPGYALASFNRGDLWNQRRALTLTWGRRDHAGLLLLSSPTGAQGLLSAQTAAAQEDHRLLLFINFATDAGWGQHPWELFGIDRENPARSVGAVRARFLNTGTERLRFELDPADPLRVTGRADHMTLHLRLVEGRFSTEVSRWDLTRDGHLDLVIHSGDPVNLHDIETAFAAVALEVGETESASGWMDSVELIRIFL